jgi:hypothetical protein
MSWHFVQNKCSGIMGANMQDMLTINGLYTTPIAQNKWSRLICIKPIHALSCCSK